MMAHFWLPLDLKTSADDPLPPLLISTVFKVDSYTIHLTDLTHIWVESLDHAEILRRAEEENTSIDPSDPSQLQILFAKLRLGLLSDPRSILKLQINCNQGDVRPAITLNLTIELPGGLAPLRWPINLAAAPESLLTSRLIEPLIQAQHARVGEIKGLKDVVVEKDNVIQKLLDKLETLGTDLGQIFPQATAKGGRRVGRARAQEKVRGLQPFNLDIWRKERVIERPTNTTDLIRQVFSHENSVVWRSITTSEENNWWEKLGDENGATQVKTPMNPALKVERSPQDSDDFQVQSSPLQPSQAAPKSSESPALDDSTDEDDFDSLSQASRIPDSFPLQPPAANLHYDASKLERVGEKERPPTISTPAPADDSTTEEEPLPSKKSKNPVSFGIKEETASLDGEDTIVDDRLFPIQTAKQSAFGKNGGERSANNPKAVLPPPPTDEETTDNEVSASPLPRATPKPKGKLGKIGGKKATSPLVPLTSPTSLTPPRAIEAPKPKKGKLGTIGGKKKETTSMPTVSEQEHQASHTPVKNKLGVIRGRDKTESPSAEAAEEIRGRSVNVEKEEKTPIPRETSEERAETKRRELKRELEIKAQAPVKKKRKF